MYVAPLVIFCFLLFFDSFITNKKKTNTNNVFSQKRALRVFLQMNESPEGFSCPQLFFFQPLPCQVKFAKVFFFLVLLEEL